MHSPLTGWQALKPRHKTLLQVIGGAMILIAAVYAVVEIPHRQAAPLKAKIQRERGDLETHERLQLEHDARKLENDARTALIQGLGGAALLIGLLFTWRSIRVTERNLQIAQDTATKNLAIAQDGQITERYTRAVEQLGSDKPEVRLGAIYALERIARDSERDHWPIMEILTAYVRERAPVDPHAEVAPIMQEDFRREDMPMDELRSKLRNRPPPLLPAAGIQAILTVVGRRTRTYGKGEDQPLNLAFTDLHETDLRGANLMGADLFCVRLDGARLNGADLRGAQLSDAWLSFAECAGTKLQGADLQAANLRKAFDLTVEQLSTVKTLYEAELDPPLLEQIQRHYPHLLEKPEDIGPS